MSSSISLELEFITGTSSEKHIVEIKQAVIGGWTARNKKDMEHHIKELEKIGVPEPKTIPTYYRVGARRLTTDDEIQAVGPESSGEAEFVLLQTKGRLWVGAGSDHTDREAEVHGISIAKQMCDKPIAPVFWPLEEVAGHWDELVLRSYATIDGKKVLYQEGKLSGLLSPSELLQGYDEGKGELEEGTLMFGGTCAAIGGVRPAEKFEFEIEDSVLGRTINHGYSIAVIPNMG